MNMLNKLIKYIRKHGFTKTCNDTIRFVFVFLKNKKRYFLNKFSIDSLIHKRRIMLSESLSKQMNDTVCYGKFLGFKLGKGYEWGKADIGNMLLGLYEKEVLQSLGEIPTEHKTLIDLGAADGYFAVGCLVAKMFDNVYCFEASTKSQKNLLDNASLNHVQDHIEIFGIATNEFPFELQKKGVDLSKCTVICDIEGGEFEVFDENALESLRNSVIIIEIHEWHENGAVRYQKLQERASKFFNITKLTTGSRDLSIFPEVAEFKDNDRWLLCSEGRHHLTTWLRLDPKN